MKSAGSIMPEFDTLPSLKPLKPLFIKGCSMGISKNVVRRKFGA
jgi:hypothetical protein